MWRPDALKIIDACPDSQWRLIIALWRFAGLRKMEIFQLRWEHVLWDQGRMLMTIPKTKHHEGKGIRIVPIGDILPWLEESFNEAPEGSQRLITRFTESNVNLAKPFEKIIVAAGFTIWPKLIQNLRASCETDWLDAGNPAHVVARWMGHSVKVQNDNYAQVDDHHFKQFNQQAKETAAAEAAKAELSDGPPVGHNSDQTPSVALQVAQNVSDQTRTDANERSRTIENPRDIRVRSRSFTSVRKSQVPEAGVELMRFLQGKRHFPKLVGLIVGQSKTVGQLNSVRGCRPWLMPGRC
ncbi:MAG: site-specific integrase [Planctomycetaceae bacterium]